MSWGNGVPPCGLLCGFDVVPVQYDRRLASCTPLTGSKTGTLGSGYKAGSIRRNVPQGETWRFGIRSWLIVDSVREA